MTGAAVRCAACAVRALRISEGCSAAQQATRQDTSRRRAMATAGVVETAELADLACGDGIFSQRGREVRS